MDSREFIHLLVEVRDLQREHLEEDRRLTQKLLKAWCRTVHRQERHGRLSLPVSG